MQKGTMPRWFASKSSFVAPNTVIAKSVTGHLGILVIRTTNSPEQNIRRRHPLSLYSLLCIYVPYGQSKLLALKHSFFLASGHGMHHNESSFLSLNLNLLNRLAINLREYFVLVRVLSTSTVVYDCLSDISDKQGRNMISSKEGESVTSSKLASDWRRRKFQIRYNLRAVCYETYFMSV